MSESQEGSGRPMTVKITQSGSVYKATKPDSRGTPCMSAELGIQYFKGMYE